MTEPRLSQRERILLRVAYQSYRDSLQKRGDRGNVLTLDHAWAKIMRQNPMGSVSRKEDQ